MNLGEWLAQQFAARRWTCRMAGTDVAGVVVDWTLEGTTATAVVEWPPVDTSIEFTRLELSSGGITDEIPVGATRVLSGNGHIARLTYDFNLAGG